MAGEDDLIQQDEIEKLLQQGGGGGTPPADPPPADEKDATADDALGQAEIEALLGGGGGASDPPADPAPSEAPPQPAKSAPPVVEDPGDADKLLAQDDIERLLNQTGTTPEEKAPEPKVARQEVAQPQATNTDGIIQGDVEYLLNQAEQALESVTEGAGELPSGVIAFQLQEFGGAPASTENATIDLISDVELDLKIELGRTNMYLEDVLRLRKGSVVPLDKLAGDPVDIYVNGRLIARGEVLVLNDNFCVRVAELIAGVDPGL
jgi:flagellar motor switch protein FliN/FliY